MLNKDNNQLTDKMMLLIDDKNKEKSTHQSIVLQCKEEIVRLEAKIKKQDGEIGDFTNLVERLLYKYVPKNKDPIDDAVASFLNSYPEKDEMKIMFLRESEGVYRFGQRKVILRADNGQQVQVKVGGGYLDIETFIK